WTDNTTSEAGFRIDRCEGGACSDFTELTTVNIDITSYVDAAVCADPDQVSSYNYQVTAIKGVDWSSLPSAADAAAISAIVSPSALTIGSVSEDTVNLEWDYASSDLTGFRVSRCDGDATFCADSGNFAAPDEFNAVPAGNQLLLHMDESSWDGTAAEVVDASGHGNNGTSYGGMTTVDSGKYSRGGWFNGTNDYISTPLNIDQSSSSPGVTFEAWVYPTANNSSDKYVISTDNGGSDWSFSQRYTTWYVLNGSGLVSTGISAPLNTWQHIVVTFHPTGGVTFYKNGNQNVWSSGTIGVDSNDTNVTIGRRGVYTTTSYHFIGGIDEAAVYNRRLSAAEVLDRYQRHFRYSDPGLSISSPYHYKVSAYKNHLAPGCNWESNDTALINTATLAPPAPDGLTLSVFDTTHIDLSWNDNATSETDYRIQWCEGTGCSFPVDTIVNSAVLGIDAQNYIDPAVCEGRDYRYRVRAEKDWISEADNTWVTDWATGGVATLSKAATDNFSATELSESEIALAWDDNNIDEDSYLLQKCLHNNAASCLVDDDAAFTDTATSVRSTLWLKMDESSWGTV
ncbi:MAG: LamG domain-containing protein, partial [Desulfuromonadales bacterium]|nr:LamG domain-containing protein [Desulfuromonadales bacterium]